MDDVVSLLVGEVVGGAVPADVDVAVEVVGDPETVVVEVSGAVVVGVPGTVVVVALPGTVVVVTVPGTVVVDVPGMVEVVGVPGPVVVVGVPGIVVVTTVVVVTGGAMSAAISMASKCM